ncbi:MAG TPA: hypothetical protein PKV98_16335 [Burkholderiaceae bacterium]|nr:hypothetical protein [Burkholderiaceae bacterium]
MTALRPRGGRPLGPISARVLQIAQTEEIWSGRVASMLQISRRDAAVVVHDLARYARIEEVDRRMVAGARKPVPVYRAAVGAGRPAPFLLLLDWPR